MQVPITLNLIGCEVLFNKFYSHDLITNDSKINLTDKRCLAKSQNHFIRTIKKEFDHSSDFVDADFSSDEDDHNIHTLQTNSQES